MTSNVDLLTSFLFFAIFAVAWYRNRFKQEPEPLSPAGIRRAYERGEITLEELERRLDVALDEEAQRIREEVEPVPGIGPEISTAIARQYDTVEDLRSASIDELEEVPGVGGSRATAIKERLI